MDNKNDKNNSDQKTIVEYKKTINTKQPREKNINSNL